CIAMSRDWEIVVSGPADAGQTVLLLPGGLNTARSYAEVMARPELAGVRTVAVTLPGHGGPAPPAGFSIANYARLVAQPPADLGCDVIAGFSMGATVAFEMAISGAFKGPVVLLGISLSLEDEPAFLNAMDRLGTVLGNLPFAAMRAMLPLAAKHTRVSADRRAELVADLQLNEPRVMKRIFGCYVSYLRASDSPAAQLCNAGVPAWVVHAEKGDGGLTDPERHALNACPLVQVVTMPGTSYFIPNEEPERVAAVLAE